MRRSAMFVEKEIGQHDPVHLPGMRRERMGEATSVAHLRRLRRAHGGGRRGGEDGPRPFGNAATTARREAESERGMESMSPDQ